MESSNYEKFELWRLIYLDANSVGTNEICSTSDVTFAIQREIPKLYKGNP